MKALSFLSKVKKRNGNNNFFPFIKFEAVYGPAISVLPFLKNLNKTSMI